MLKIIETHKDVFKVVGPQGNPSVEEIKEHYGIADVYFLNMALALTHISTFIPGEQVLLLPSGVSREACESFIHHFNTLIDHLIDLS